MYILLMALSTGGYGKNTCIAEKGLIDDQDASWKCEYQTQLEPTVYFLMDHTEDEIKILLLCSIETLEAKSGEKSRVDVFKENIQIRANKVNKRMPQVEVIDMSVSDETGAIKDAAGRLIKEASTQENRKLWIDTHGGLRDIAFTLNSIVSLLHVYSISVDRFVTVVMPQIDKDTGEEICPAIIKNASKSFDMFDFVSGMNEFNSFGIADKLDTYLRLSTDKQLINPIIKISNGTRLCDPVLYLEGLKELGKEVDQIHKGQKKPEGYISIFVDYIEKDYGVLLDNENRTVLDIIIRCEKKKLYQQALTFIESLMPHMFHERRILFYDRDREDELISIMEKAKKQYEKPEHFAFDQYCLKLSGYCKGEDSNKLDDTKAIKVLNQDISQLKGDFIVDSTCVITVATQVGVCGKVEIGTCLMDNYKEQAGKLLRLHKAIKRCRNMINHASSGVRPTVEQIEKGINTYIDLAKEVFSENSCGGNPVFQGLTEAFSTKTQNTAREKKPTPFCFEAKRIGCNKKKKKRLEGILSNGEEAMVPFLEQDLSQYLGKTLTVQVINDNGGDGPKQCKIVHLTE